MQDLQIHARHQIFDMTTEEHAQPARARYKGQYIIILYFYFFLPPSISPNPHRFESQSQKILSVDH